MKIKLLVWDWCPCQVQYVLQTIKNTATKPNNDISYSSLICRVNYSRSETRDVEVEEGEGKVWAADGVSSSFQTVGLQVKQQLRFGRVRVAVVSCRGVRPACRWSTDRRTAAVRATEERSSAACALQAVTSSAWRSPWQTLGHDGNKLQLDVLVICLAAIMPI